MILLFVDHLLYCRVEGNPSREAIKEPGMGEANIVDLALAKVAILYPAAATYYGHVLDPIVAMMDVVVLAVPKVYEVVIIELAEAVVDVVRILDMDYEAGDDN